MVFIIVISLGLVLFPSHDTHKVAKNEGVEMTDNEGKAKEITREELVGELGKKGKNMTLKTWEKSLTQERLAELDRIASQAEKARECDEESAWAEFSETTKSQSDGGQRLR